MLLDMSYSNEVGKTIIKRLKHYAVDPAQHDITYLNRDTFHDIFRYTYFDFIRHYEIYWFMVVSRHEDRVRFMKL